MRPFFGQDKPLASYEDCYMSTHKRDFPVHLLSQPPSKKQKSSHPPPTFWDNLSQVWLTKGALRELDRRNSRLVQQISPARRIPGPYTRSALTEWKRREENWQPEVSAKEYLSRSLGHLDDIKSFSRHGGPDLSDLRGYKPPIPLRKMSSTPSGSRAQTRGSRSGSNTKPTTSSKKSSPYSRNFEQNVIDHGVLPYGYLYPDGRVPAKPANWEEIKMRLLRPRRSLSPSRFSEAAHEGFAQADAGASKEKQVTDCVIPIIEGEIEHPSCVSGGIPFTNLDPLTDGEIVSGNPDRYYGARPEQLDRQVRKELSGRIIPSTQESLPIAPNFFLTVKGPDGKAAIAKRQASYDGALGARGMNELRSYGLDKPEFDNQAYTISSIYNDGTLKIYTTHPVCGSDGRPEYIMKQIDNWGMTGNLETFRKGAAAYRNLRDWAKEKRDEMISQANDRVLNDRALKYSAAVNASGLASLDHNDTPGTFGQDSASTARPRSPEAPLNANLPNASAKHFRSSSDEVHRRQKKRHNPGESNDILQDPAEPATSSVVSPVVGGQRKPT